MSFCKNHAIICDGCGKFCNPYDEEILFGTKSYEFPEPLDPYHYCKKCYLKNKKKWIHLFRNGSRHGSWQKSKAESEAAKELHLIWVHSNGIGTYGTKSYKLYTYVTKKEYDYLSKLPKY